MIWVLFVVVLLAVLAFFGAVLTGRVGVDPLSEAVSSTPAAELPALPTAQDVAGVRFDTALRGYRMDQVDQVLDLLQRRLTELEQSADAPHRLAELEQSVDAPQPPPAASGTATRS